MAFQQSDLDALNQAIANSTVEVRYRDRTVRYRSMQELLMAKETIEAELNAGSPKAPRQVRFGTDNGFGKRWSDDCY